MYINNGSHNLPATLDHIYLVSVDPMRIILPYTGEWYGDICLGALDVVWAQKGCDLDYGQWRFSEIIADADMDIYFNVQSKVVHTTAHFTITTVDGDYIKGSIPITMTQDEIITILDAFFATDGSMDAEMRFHYRDAYLDWKEKLKQIN